jgi:hypothetical protein
MRIFTYALIVLLMTFLASCSSSGENNVSNGENSKEQKVDVDKGLLSVVITLPASMFEDKDANTVIADAKKEGIEVTKNEDDSFTYKMSKAKHKEMMAEIEKSINETIDETVNSEDFVSIKDITHNNSFTEFTLVVDKGSYENSMDSFAALGLGMSGMMYQLYNGVDSDEYIVTISLKDQTSQEVFDEIIYPDDMKE